MVGVFLVSVGRVVSVTLRTLMLPTFFLEFSDDLGGIYLDLFSLDDGVGDGEVFRERQTAAKWLVLLHLLQVLPVSGHLSSLL